MIQIDQRMIKACLLVAAKNDIRFYLEGIKIEATKTHTTAIATDGHRLFAIRIAAINEIEDDVCFILPKPVAKTMAKEKRPKTVFKERPEGKIAVTLQDGDLEFFPVDGKFPNWTKPSEIKLGKQNDLCINAKYLGYFGEISSIITNSKFASIMLSNNESESGGVLISFPTSDFESYGICMPVRSDNEYYPRNRIPTP